LTVREKLPEDTKVCHTCGTRHGKLVFEDKLKVSEGVCDVCGKSGAVSLASYYGGLEFLPHAQLVSIVLRHEARTVEEKA